MILSALLFGATVLTVGGLLAQFWNDITDWLKRAINRVKEVIGRIAEKCAFFAKKISEGLQAISKHYHKNGTEWEEFVIKEIIPENEVPEEIRAKVNTYRETDLTEELKMQLAS